MKLLATGIFMWRASERQTDRYGAFYAASESYRGDTTKAKTHALAVNSLIGKRVRVVVKVLENRESGHIGDHFHGIMPNPLKAGKELEIGVGILAQELIDGHVNLQIRPEDRRKEFWIDPRLMFQLHDQTVEIYAEESAVPAHPVFKGNTVVDEAITVEETKTGGVLQTKTKTPGADVAIAPTIENMGDGLFIMSGPAMKVGSRHKLHRR